MYWKIYKGEGTSALGLMVSWIRSYKFSTPLLTWSPTFLHYILLICAFIRSVHTVIFAKTFLLIYLLIPLVGWSLPSSFFLLFFFVHLLYCCYLPSALLTWLTHSLTHHIQLYRLSFLKNLKPLQLCVSAFCSPVYKELQFGLVSLEQTYLVALNLSLHVCSPSSIIHQ